MSNHLKINSRWKHIKSNDILYITEQTTVDIFSKKTTLSVIYRDAKGRIGTTTLGKWNKYMRELTEPETNIEFRARLDSEIASWPEWKRNIKIGK